jgi:hypothetical protein
MMAASSEVVITAGVAIVRRGRQPLRWVVIMSLEDHYNTTEKGAFFIPSATNKHPRYPLDGVHGGDGIVWLQTTNDVSHVQAAWRLDLGSRTVEHPTYGSFSLRQGTTQLVVGQPLPIEGPSDMFGDVRCVLDPSFGVDPNAPQNALVHYPDDRYADSVRRTSLPQTRPEKVVAATVDGPQRGYRITSKEQMSIPRWTLHPDGPLGQRGLTEMYMRTENGSRHPGGRCIRQDHRRPGPPRRGR